jgi:O-antigen/teichoic acid export membrane protein
MAQASASVILSHVLATRPYVISFDREISWRIWHFGWPLTVNALFLYAVFQGERMLVGGMLGLETLGSYGIVAQLALLPVMISGRLALNIALPLLAGRRAEQTAGGARDVASIFASGGLLFWAVFVFACPPFIALLFGEAYQPHPADLGWIAAAAAIRMQKTGPATVLLAAGRSRAVLAGSSIRLAGLGIGTLLLFLTRDLTVFIATAALSEAASHAAICRRAASETGRGAMSMALAPLPILALGVAWSVLHGHAELMIPVCVAAALAALVSPLRIALRHMPSRGRPAVAAIQVNG